MRSFNDPSMSIWARLMELIPGWSGRRALEGKWETRENAPTQTAGGSPDSDPFLSLFCEAWNDDRGCVVDRHRSPRHGCVAEVLNRWRNFVDCVPNRACKVANVSGNEGS
jgi:hypothetical protein